MRKVRFTLSYSNVVSTLCLFLVLGGGAYAATRLPKSSVGTSQLKANAVTGGKVKDHSLTGGEINGPVALAVNAGHAINADHAGTADSASHSSQADAATSAGNADRLDGKDSSDYTAAGSEAWHDDILNDGSGGEFCH